MSNEKKALFIEPSAQKKWWFALQRGETTAEHITKYFAKSEPREHWRSVYKSYFVFLKKFRVQLGEGYLHNEDYRRCHDAVARMFLQDVKDNYTDITAEIASRYLTIYDGKENSDEHHI